MIDREKVIRHIVAEISIAKTCKKDFASVDINMLSDALVLLKEQQQQIWELEDQVEYLTDKQKKKFLVDSDGKITPLPDVVLCTDCIHRGKAEKCVLAAISEEKNFPLFMLDNRGEWFCADGRRLEES